MTEGSRKWLVGCGIGCFLLVVLIVGLDSRPAKVPAIVACAGIFIFPFFLFFPPP